jgi:hypothetical protein
VVEMETVIVDSHKEVLPYWLREYQRQKHPLVEVRIDQHHDMSHECPALPAREGRQIFEYLEKITNYILEYTDREINEANYTCPAFHYGFIGALYHFNPRAKDIDAYGRVSRSKFINAPKTKREATLIRGKRHNRIVWDENLTRLRIQGGKVAPIPQKITIDEFKKDLLESCFPTVIGFDLDGICGIGENGLTIEAMSNRLDKSKHILECVSSPKFACVARSQTPRAYVPPELVDGLQEDVVKLIEETYA